MWLGVAIAGGYGGLFGVVAGGSEGLMIGGVTGAGLGVVMAAVEWRIRRDQPDG